MQRAPPGLPQNFPPAAPVGGSKLAKIDTFGVRNRKIFACGALPDRVKWPMQSDLFEDYRPANVAPPFRILPWDHVAYLWRSRQPVNRPQAVRAVVVELVAAG